MTGCGGSTGVGTGSESMIIPADPFWFSSFAYPGCTQEVLDALSASPNLIRTLSSPSSIAEPSPLLRTIPNYKFSMGEGRLSLRRHCAQTYVVELRLCP